MALPCQDGTAMSGWHCHPDSATHFLCNSKVHSLVHSSPPLASNLSQISPVHTLVQLAAHHRSNTETDYVKLYVRFPTRLLICYVFLSTETNIK